MRRARLRRILDHAASGGITFLDTADVYPLGGSLEAVGRTEEVLGQWLGSRRDDFVIATKCFGAMSARPWDRGSSRKHILDAIEGSLRRLRTGYVALYQFHHPDAGAPPDETLRALDDVMRAGKAHRRAESDKGPDARWVISAQIWSSLSGECTGPWSNGGTAWHRPQLAIMKSRPPRPGSCGCLGEAEGASFPCRAMAGRPCLASLE